MSSADETRETHQIGQPPGQPQNPSLDPKTNVSPVSLEDAERQFHVDNPIWKELMKGMKCHIDHYILRILDITGYKSFHTLKKITDKSIDAMEAFVKGDDIRSRVDEGDLKLYLGPVKKKEFFSFQPGERDLILGIADFVKKNHVESRAPLGKLISFPIFMKKSSSNSIVSGNQKGSEEPATKKKRVVEKVVSFDVPKEVTKIRKLIHDHCVKKAFPKEVIAALPRIQVEVKTIELQSDDVDGDFDNQQSATLAGKLLCPFCKKYQSCSYRQGYWITSNMHRHLSQHVTNGDIKKQGSLTWPCSSKTSMAGNDSVNNNQNKQDKAGENTQEDQLNDGNQSQEIANPGTVPTETTTLSSDDNHYESVSENSLGDGLVSTSMEPKEPPSLSSPTTALESQKDSGIDSEKPKQALKQVGIKNF